MDVILTHLGMGGYAGFVWPSYGVTVVLLLAVAVSSVRTMRATEAELKSLQATHGDRRTAALKADAAHDT